MGFEKYIKLKPDVYPKFFNCQKDRPTVAHTSQARPLVEKRKKQEVLQAALENDLKKRKENENLNLVSESGVDIFEESNLQEILDLNLENSASTPKSKNAATQTIVETRNKKIQFNVNRTFGRRRGVNTETPTATTPREKVYPAIFSSSSSSSSDEDNDDAEFDPNNTIMSAYSDTLIADENEKVKIRERMLNIIKEKPLTFLGLPQENIFVCERLAHYQKVDIIFIFICLLKIRLDLSFDVLSSLFSYSSSHIARCFNSNIRGIAKLLSTLVYWPTPELVKHNLPIPFRFRYKNVYCIIDCLEIEIQKSSDPQHQSATWSEYKKCNTAKYLVACTPQGLINFISTGYGGRITDAKIIEISGFLNHLVPGMQIMADRGFKSVDSLLLKKGCTLVRPPSVFANVKPTKDEVKETKRIASLRVIIENVIGRLRHFSQLSPHACVPIKNLDQLDFTIQTACGLINLQHPVRAPL